MRIARSVVGWSSALLLVVLAGCDSGPPMGQVSGKVTLDNQPIKGLEVNFSPQDAKLGTTATGYTQADGTYTLYYPGSEEGAPAGDYIVSIAPGEGGEEGGPQVQIPAKYNSASELRRTVKPGQNQFDFELTSQ